LRSPFAKDRERRRHRAEHDRTPCECGHGDPPRDVVAALIAASCRCAAGP
jgi:hypothetical protein